MSIGRVPGATGIQPSIVDAKGDLIVATAADSVDRLAVGSNNTVLTADSATATGLKWAALPASGKVLQVVAGTGATVYEGIKSASATDVTNMSVTITPSATSSKILVIGMLNGINSQTSSAQDLDLALANGSNTTLYLLYSRTVPANSAGIAHLNIPFSYLHSPSSTSALTYKLRVTNNTSAVGIYVNNGNSNITSSIIALEIGA